MEQGRNRRMLSYHSALNSGDLCEGKDYPHRGIKCCLTLPYATSALPPHNRWCLKVAHAPSETEGAFCWRPFSHGPRRVRAPSGRLWLPCPSRQHSTQLEGSADPLSKQRTQAEALGLRLRGCRNSEARTCRWESPGPI